MAELTELRQYTQVGNIKRMLSTAAQIETYGVEYTPLANAIRQSAREFNTESVLAWLTKIGVS